MNLMDDIVGGEAVHQTDNKKHIVVRLGGSTDGLHPLLRLGPGTS
jgi:hypothetical protein